MNKQALANKQGQVSALDKGLKENPAMVIVSYQGLTVAEMQELRKTLKENGASVGVYKNTMARRALKENGDPDLGDLLNGPNAFVFSKDISKGPKALVKFSRYHEALVIKGAVMEGKVLSKDEVVAVSKLPDRNGMLSMLLSVLQAPVRQFAATLQAIADSKSPAGEAPAAN